ncbi:MAG: hypothetical protein ABSH53_01335 [Holophaga sp.]|jgi:UDP-3-O-[3-hydroxymyristoyl] glucosamine N-acyltransferase
MVSGSASVGDHCLIGGRTTVTDPVNICAGVQLGGLSAVTKDITEPGAYGGHPLQPFKAFLRTTPSLAHLPDMRKRLADLEKRVLVAGTGDRCRSDPTVLVFLGKWLKPMPVSPIG